MKCAAIYAARAALGLAPLALTPLLGLALAEGWLDLGGGEKDLLLLVPWLLWSVAYLALVCVHWWRGRTSWRGAGRAGWQATVLLLVLWAGLLAYSLGGS